MNPIRKFKVNQSSPFVRHRVYKPGPEAAADPSVANPNTDREFYVIQSSLEDQRRVLTVRTQYVLMNHTQTTYQVKQFYVTREVVDGKSVKKIQTLQKADLPPNASIPLPDHADTEIQAQLKMCVKPIDSKRWSDEFKVSAMKKKLVCGQNIMWNHHKNYSILRKEATVDKEVFNFLLLPALLIKNCLPLPIKLTLSQVMKAGEGDNSARSS